MIKFRTLLAAGFALLLVAMPLSAARAATVVDDFESGLPAGSDGNGLSIGFYSVAGSAGISFATTSAHPAPVPGEASGNQVLEVDTDVGENGFAVVIHAFENPGVDTWVTQDWSGFEGFGFWLYGNNTGSVLFIDILDNRNPGSTIDDAERFSYEFTDNFSGWQYFEIPFTDFFRKEIGNGAPNDGFTLTEIHGWAFGVFNSRQQFVNYLDDVGVYGVGGPPPLQVMFAAGNWDVNEGDMHGVFPPWFYQP